MFTCVKTIISLILAVFVVNIQAMEVEKPIENLELDVVHYDALMQNDPEAMTVLERACNKKGIVGVKGIPGYREKVLNLIETARLFSALPEEVKEAYAPNSEEMFLGYEKGKEKFKRPDGKWVIDDLKTSYYGLIPDGPLNKWPNELDLKTPFQELGHLMMEMGQIVMQKIGLIDSDFLGSLEDNPRVGRMLYYCKSKGIVENPLWCGAHFDHGLFTALVPAFYFVDGKLVPEPLEAGLFVRPTDDSEFKKVMADDPDVMLFQVGEFGQLMTNDKIKATEHRVHKASGPVERYTMVLFFNAPADKVICSNSVLTQDARYGGQAGDTCSYRHWHEESFKRYIVKDKAR
jgi:isopenicillin N synthase-like dioxygenase